VCGFVWNYVEMCGIMYNRMELYGNEWKCVKFCVEMSGNVWK